MEFDPYAPYGPLVETTARVVTWNVWGQFGEPEVRDPLIDAELRRVDPDIVCLTESWATASEELSERIRADLGHVAQRHFGSRDPENWSTGIGISSRWPIVSSDSRPLTDEAGDQRGLLAVASIDGPRGLIQLYVVMLDYPLGASRVRQRQVRQALEVLRTGDRRALTILCGDFNAPPDSDEIRMLTGRRDGVDGLVFYDAWEVAGDGGPGITFAKENPLTAPNLLPNRRFDYIFTAWPRAGGCGHPVRAKLVGTIEQTKTPASDHYGVLADVRY